MLKLTAGLLLGNEMTHTHRVAAVTVLTVLSFWLLGTASIVFWIIGLWFSTNLMRMPWLQLENIHSWLCVFYLGVVCIQKTQCRDLPKDTVR